MTQLKAYLRRADELAQDVIDAWNASAASLTPEFKALLHIAFLYKTARQTAEDHRAFDILSDSDEVRERAARLMFLRACKIYFDRQAARLN